MVNLITHDPYATLENALGYHFKNRHLLEQALTYDTFLRDGITHRSGWRLRSVGRGVLTLVVSEKLYKNTEEGEGRLSKITRKLHNDSVLAALAKHIRLEDYIIKQSESNPPDIMLTKTIKSLIGAMYLDSGRDLKAIHQFVDNYWDIMNNPGKLPMQHL
jgi:ribonuclease-3